MAKDLVVIGGGPAGYVAAIRARQLGMDVCLIEKNALGGTCLNKGCIPTKAYYQNASILRTLERLQDFNISAEQFSFDMFGAYRRKNEIVSELKEGIQNLLQANKVEVKEGAAKIISAAESKKVLSGEEEIEAKRILIATGSYAAKIPIAGKDLEGVLTSDEILELTEVPRRLVVIGAGVVGVEFAAIFSSFGSEVTLLELLPTILSGLDQDIIKRAEILLKRQKIKILTGAETKEIKQKDGSLEVRALTKKGEECFAADKVLIATGRKPYTAGMGLEKIGVSCSNGFINVNEDYETNIKGIYAVGDVIGGPMLAHVASAEGIVAVERMSGFKSSIDYHAVPSCVFTFPEIATVGLTAEEMKKEGREMKIGKFPFAANGKALTMAERDGFVKVIADADDIICGVHIIGPHASDLIQEASVIVRNKLKIEDVADSIHPHPTLGEALNEAVLDAAHKAIHLISR